MRICQWPNRSATLQSVTSKLEAVGMYEKATAISLFYGRVADALEILNRGAKARQGQCFLNCPNFESQSHR